MDPKESFGQLLSELGDAERVCSNPTRAALLCDNLENLTKEGAPFAGVPLLDLSATYAEIAVGYAKRVDALNPDSAEAHVNDHLREYFMSRSMYFSKE